MSNLPPVAIDDLFTTDEVSPVTGNVFADQGSGPDSDPEGDSFVVTAINGVEANVGVEITLGSGALVTLNANGTFSYDPNGAFDGLNAGDIGNDLFNYTIEAKPDPGAQTQFTEVTLSTSQDVTLSINAPEVTCEDDIVIEGSLSVIDIEQDPISVVFVIDVSGSTFGSFAGSAVGDVNGDGNFNTILDAEIASYLELSDQIASLGFDPTDLQISLVAFSSSATTVGTFEAGSAALEAALTSLNSGGGTNFNNALAETINVLNPPPGDVDFVYFLSDGEDFGPSITANVNTLANDFDAQIVAVGVGGGAILTQLDQIDTTGGAEIVLTSDALTAALIGSPLANVAPVDFDILVNGAPLPGVDVNDLTETPFGFDVNPQTIPGSSLNAGNNTIIARIEFDDGSVVSTPITVENVDCDDDAAVTFNITGLQAGLEVAKTADTPSVSAIGEVVNYDYSVTNTGNVVLTDVTLNDDLLGPITLAGLTDEDGDTFADDLAVGATATGTASVTVTQAMLDAGAAIVNTAVGDSNETSPDQAVESVDIAQDPALEVTKVADVSLVNADGDIINYEYTVSNTGNVNLTNVTLDDDLLGSVGLVGLTDEDGDGDADDLAVGATATGTLSTAVTQAQIDAGTDIVNTATADSDETAPETAMEDVSIDQDSALEVRKSAGVSTVDNDGDQIVYSYEIENTGNTSLTNVVLNDDLLGAVTLAGLTDEDGDTFADDLAVGATATGVLTATVTQAQIDSGLDIVNVATADSDETAPETATESVTVDQTPMILITKDADVTTVAADGDLINYIYLVENIGNQTLTNVTLSDDLLGLVTLVGLTDEDGDTFADDLAVGASATGALTATVTQAQIDAGIPITNVATADSEETAPATATESVDIDAVSGINVTKIADVATVNADGDQIVYDYTVVNTGAVTLTDVTLNDDLLGAVALAGLTDEDGDTFADDLAVGATATGTLTATVTQAEIDSGLDITNIATGDSNETGPDTATQSVSIVTTPLMTVAKAADVALVDADGDVINYSYEVVNAGNVTLTDVTLNDDLLGAVTLVGLTDEDGDTFADDLAVGATATGALAATVSQAQIDAGLPITNVVTGDSDETGPATATESVDVDADPGIAVTKVADVATVDADGDLIVYDYTVANTGAVTLTDVVLNDDLLGAVTLVGLTDEDGDTFADDLAVGASATGTLTATVTQAEIDSGSDITNIATADSNETAPETATQSVTIDQTPILSVTKDADVSVVAASGDQINYTYLVQNDGNQTLTNVTLSDDLLGAITLVGLTDEDGDTFADDLAVGATATGLAVATVSQTQIDAGLPITNVATADSDETAPTTATESVDVDGDASIDVTKLADVSTVANDGDLIVYDYTVVNTGALTLTDVTLNDDLLGAVTLVGLTDEDGDTFADDLAVGATATGTLTAAVTQAEIDSGFDITNIATGNSNETGPDTATQSVSIITMPMMTVAKQADVSIVDAVGDLINYSYEVVNGGNVSLTDVTLNDDLLGAITLVGLTDEDGDGDADDLAVGATATGAAVATVTQADLDSGLDITNVATGDSDETGPATATESVTIEQLPMMTVSKSADKVSVSTAGEFVVYSYAVENTGNVALNNVSLNDDILGVVSLGGLTDEDGDGDLDDLAAGETAIGQVTIAVTQADITAGVDIVNVATVTSDETGPETATETVSIEQNPSMSVEKSVDMLFVSNPGDIVNYGYIVNNTGNVALTNVTLDDDLLGPVILNGLTDEDGDGDADDLAVGASATGTLQTVITSADLESGSHLVNIATALTEETAPETATQAVALVPNELCCGLSEFVRPALFDATQIGDADGNSLNGGNGDSVIFGNDGDDTLSGNGGENGLVGNDGDDILNGGNGADSMFGDLGNDILNGNAGDDELSGGFGDDKLYGGGGDDDILAGGGDDLVEGGDGVDRICGGAGNDTIQGEGGDDCIAGGEDDGFITGSAGAGFTVTLGDTLFGNGGADRFEYNDGDGIDLLLGFSAAEGDTLVIAGHTEADAQFISGSTVYGDFAGIVFDNGVGGLEGVFFQQEQNPLALQGLVTSGAIDFI